MASKTLIAIALGLTAALGVGANAAFAGEVTGNGKPIEVHGASLCAYSGLNDTWVPEDHFGRVQSYGQIPKEDRDDYPSPGQACNPTNY